MRNGARRDARLSGFSDVLSDAGRAAIKALIGSGAVDTRHRQEDKPRCIAALVSLTARRWGCASARSH
jgi:hypothetical protein